MEALILYFGKVIICSGVMFLYYQLSLKDKTFHHYNRFYLLFAMIVSIFLPLIRVEDFTIEVSNDIYLLISKIQNLNTNKTADHDYIYFRIVFSALGLVSFYFLGKLIYGVLKINQFKKQFQKETFEGVNFYQTNLSEAPFSYFRNLFWKNTIVINSDIGKQILKHEMVHIEQKHSYDKIFIEIITAIFWFNPFFHIIKKEISLIHEYLADKKAVKQSDTKAFAQMLLASLFSGKELPATSPFLSSNLKKRLKMLQKPQTKFGYARRIFALPVLFTVAFAYMVNAKNKEIAETNIEIEKAVSEIKKDTISLKSNIDQIVEIQEAKISKANEQLKIQSEKLKTLSEKSKEKAAELKKIAKEKGDNSYEFELKAKELKQLSGEMDKIVNKDKVFNDLEFSTISANGKNYTFKLNENRGKTIDMSNREDEGYKKSKKILDDRFIEIFEGKNEEGDDLNEFLYSKEFKEKSGMTDQQIRNLKEGIGQRLGKVNKFYLSGKDLMANSDEVKKIANEYSLKGYNFKDFPSSLTKKELSKKELRKLEKLTKERAATEKKLQEIRKEQRELQGNPWMISIDAHAPKVNYSVASTYIESPMPADSKILSKSSVYTTTAKDMIISNSTDNVKIFIDGKASSNEEMKKIDPKKIASVTVNKTKTIGNEAGEIHIKMKD